MGDVILSLDGTPVAEHVSRTSKYYPTSNEAARLRDMTWPLTRGACDEELSFEIRRGMRELTVRERRAEYDEMDFGRYLQHGRPDEAFQKLADSISYLGGRDEVLEAGIRILREHTSDAEIRKMALRR